MNKFFKKLKKNNKGSSLIVVVIASSFIAILGAVVMSSASANYRLKIMNEASKRTFYTADTALDEIYSGIGEKCFDALNDAYINTVITLDDSVVEALGSTDTANEYANRKMKETYYKTMCDELDILDLRGYLNNFITQGDLASVVSVGTVSTDAASTKITLNDVYVVCEENEYYAQVCVDMVLTYPDLSFNLIDDRNHLNTYLDFSMIGMDGVLISSANNSVTGNIYAGDENHRVSSDGKPYYGLNVWSDFSVKDSLVVSAADCNFEADFTAEDAKIWCVNFTEKGTNDTISTTDTSLYLADDLNFDSSASGNSVTLRGALYGFGRYTGADAFGNSSAIVVNGTSNELNIEGLDSLLLGGRAYVDLSQYVLSGESSVTGYMTGDSIGLKGMQEIYLVPSAYMKVRNPIATSDLINLDSDLAANPVDVDAMLTNPLFADLLTSSGYRAVIVGGGQYYFLDFKSNSAMATYVARLLNSSFLNTSDVTKYNDPNSAYYDTATYKQIQSSYNELSKLAAKCVDNLSDSTIATGSNVIVNGNMYTINDSGVVVSAGGYTSTGSANVSEMNGGDLLCEDRSTRYTILNYFLYDMGDDSTTDCAGFDTSAGQTVEIPILNADGTDGAAEVHTIYDSGSYYDYVIDTGKFANAEYNETTYSKVIKADNVAVLVSKEVKDGSGKNLSELVKVGDTVYHQGVVLAYNVDIIVDCDFTGLIITNGVINVSGSGRYTLAADREISETTIKGDKVLSSFFFAYQGNSDEGLSADDISSSDLLNFNNWRKNYVYIETETTEESTEAETE